MKSFHALFLSLLFVALSFSSGIAQSPAPTVRPYYLNNKQSPQLEQHYLTIVYLKDKDGNTTHTMYMFFDLCKTKVRTRTGTKWEYKRVLREYGELTGGNTKTMNPWGGPNQVGGTLTQQNNGDFTFSSGDGSVTGTWEPANGQGPNATYVPDC